MLSATQVAAQTVGPAPEGEAAVVAQRIILDNFDPPDCPLVVAANRLGDGSIKAICNNNESFRIFSVQEVGPVALKCSVAPLLGISGC
jgi:hypothetical protein